MTLYLRSWEQRANIQHKIKINQTSSGDTLVTLSFWMAEANGESTITNHAHPATGASGQRVC